MHTPKKQLRRNEIPVKKDGMKDGVRTVKYSGVVVASDMASF